MQMDFTQAVTWAISLVGVACTVFLFLVKQLLGQMEKRLGERFAGMDKELGRIAQVERELLHFKAELPLLYVHRQDYVRNQTVIEAKLDGLRDKLEVVQLKGASND
ncbi:MULTISPECIES: hypothetical protein [unclassified Pseudomonas]|uniref:hypothetical protein n=1 Tax=unclassified Pseudomonas TaxID=196821 RepID=UPI000DA917C8|nr:MULTISPECIES: hypothetical protein [unclassified Pseudomonas]MDW3715333.1 hypothetical protein [Pseudomonas sp. 2023EL-01195]PZE10554.1 hypothetical protein DMX10_25585 [Pseudomonas sp. 57B-090624]